MARAWFDDDVKKHPRAHSAWAKVITCLILHRNLPVFHALLTHEECGAREFTEIRALRNSEREREKKGNEGGRHSVMGTLSPISCPS
jgi:hypothetical protein